MDLLVGICTDQGATVLVATHDREQVARYSFREVYLLGGRVKSDYRPSETRNGDVVALKQPHASDEGEASATPSEQATTKPQADGTDESDEPNSGSHAS